MKKYLLSSLLLLPLYCLAHVKELPSNQIKNIQDSTTNTYVKCWHRASDNHNEQTVKWEWALDDDGNYYSIPGYWYSKLAMKNMFYTDIPSATIIDHCKKTIHADNDPVDLTAFAADTQFSHNHTIWSNNKSTTNDAPSKIDKIISIGDSMSDTGNLHNYSQSLLPNNKSWFFGRLSNGLVWTEYLAKEKNIPLYNWSIAGCQGEDSVNGLIPGVISQLDSYLEYIQVAKGNANKNVLVTLEFGYNDFISGQCSAEEVINVFTYLLRKSSTNGIKNMLVLNLPEIKQMPIAKHMEDYKVQKIHSEVIKLNNFIAQEISRYQERGYNFILYDAYSFLHKLITSPQDYGIHNTTDTCLDINNHSQMNYFLSHKLRTECALYGADSYIFWEHIHPTTKVHELIAKDIKKTILSDFNF
ncbi:MAG: SGNH/GDSL hydrolase family protein [Candidatus Endonucleobacter sp. (ex Gigantidas childressi)]|nr:SGNH/GDSL hydrolase family protein [Candidatus Endonucleobacter sp. (ex Gigantidas childressi)]